MSKKTLKLLPFNTSKTPVLEWLVSQKKNLVLSKIFKAHMANRNNKKVTKANDKSLKTNICVPITLDDQNMIEFTSVT